MELGFEFITGFMGGMALWLKYSTHDLKHLSKEFTDSYTGVVLIHELSQQTQS